MIPALPPLTPKQARQILGLSTYQFWTIIHRYNVPRLQYGPRCHRFTQAVVDELREFFTVRSPADMRRISDGRRKLSWLGQEAA